MDLDVRWIHRRVYHGDSRRFPGWIIDGYTPDWSGWDLRASASMANWFRLSIGKLELEYPAGRYACVQDFHANCSGRQRRWSRRRSRYRRWGWRRSWSTRTCASATASPASANSQRQHGDPKPFHPDRLLLSLVDHSQLPGRTGCLRQITL